MQPESALLVQSSFRILLPVMDMVTARFLARLAGEVPAATALLRGSGPSERRWMAACFAFAVRSLDDFEIAEPTLRMLGARCRASAIGVRELDAAGEALLETLAEALGANWTPHVAAAWREFWREIVRGLSGAPRPRAAAREPSPAAA